MRIIDFHLRWRVETWCRDTARYISEWWDYYEYERLLVGLTLAVVAFLSLVIWDMKQDTDLLIRVLCEDGVERPICR